MWRRSLLAGASQAAVPEQADRSQRIRLDEGSEDHERMMVFGFVLAPGESRLTRDKLAAPFFCPAPRFAVYEVLKTNGAFEIGLADPGNANCSRVLLNAQTSLGVVVSPAPAPARAPPPALIRLNLQRRHAMPLAEILHVLVHSGMLYATRHAWGSSVESSSPARSARGT